MSTLRRQKKPMKNAARQYSCASCHKKVTICRACDRGNVYCGSICSGAARKVTLHAASRKYQSNQKGRLKNAERQKRYRLRIKKIVTHHTSKLPSSHDLLPPTINKTSSSTENIAMASDHHCHFCGSPINKWNFDGKHE